MSNLFVWGFIAGFIAGIVIVGLFVCLLVMGVFDPPDSNSHK